MKVYVVSACWSDDKTLRDYTEIIGVYSDLKNAITKQNETKAELYTYFSCDCNITNIDATVAEFEVK